MLGDHATNRTKTFLFFDWPIIEVKLLNNIAIFIVYFLKEFDSFWLIFFNDLNKNHIITSQTEEFLLM